MINYDDQFEPEDKPVCPGADMIESDTAKSRYERLIELREYQRGKKHEFNGIDNK